jgi:glycosyltransferase involved in cell wall biosynthesis
VKIGFIEPHLKVFGGIRRIVDMANELADRGHDTTIYHSDGSPCTWLECRARVAPGRAVLEDEHDVIVFNDPVPEDMYLARHARSKVTYYYALGLYRKDLMAGFHPALYLRRHRRTRRLRECLRSQHRKLANSSWIQRWLRDHMRIDSDLLIGGVNFGLFHPVEVERARDEEFRILCNGDKRPGKGTETVVEAVEILRRSVPGVVLDTYHGKGIAQDKMAATYASADLFLDATYNNGGWNNAVVEAMACRVPVACTSIGQNEDFAFDGKTALLSPPQDAGALADNIRALIHDGELRDRIAQNALDHIRTFEWSRAIDRFEEIAVNHIEASR